MPAARLFFSPMRDEPSGQSEIALADSELVSEAIVIWTGWGLTRRLRGMQGS
jgi:hypothetical protein